MQIIKIDKEEYQGQQYYFRFLYNKTHFLESLPNDKKFSFFKIVGEKQKTKFLFYIVEDFSPFLNLPNPAPYWCIESVRKQEKPENYISVIKLIKEYFFKVKKTISITLPSNIYDKRYINLITKSLLDEDFIIQHTDYNHHLDINLFKENLYLEYINSDARRNLKVANNASLQFKKLRQKEYSFAYDVIKANRIAKSYPLKISKEQMIINLSNFEGDVFAVFKDEVMIASALVFGINASAKQLIYWGDLPEYSKSRPMNFLAFEMLKYYKNTSTEILDLGPSSDEGEINSGLSNFKESIGALTSLKFTLTYKSL
ncbi:hypothetical protein ACFQ0R_12110 [Psychroflexus salinarum]|uniref:Acetyltransferase (GNAT) domain-containing protein n=1 Tax=Psychroflexus salinarum TaxID=546024 RepID=A0ABW3GXS4_9FLAO